MFLIDCFFLCYFRKIWGVYDLGSTGGGSGQSWFLSFTVRYFNRNHIFQFNMVSLVQLKFLKQHLSQISDVSSTGWFVVTKNGKIRGRKRVSKSILNNFNVYLNVPGIKYYVRSGDALNLSLLDPVKIYYSNILFDKDRFTNVLSARSGIAFCLLPIYQIILLINERKRSCSY